MVVQDIQSGSKVVTAIPDTTGKIEIPIILSTGDFEFTVEMFDAGGEMTFFFMVGEQNLKFEVLVSSGIASLEDEISVNADSWQDDGRNTIRLMVNNGIAELFVNNVFFKKVTLSNDKLNVSYDTLVVTNIDDEHIIYNMNLTNGISGSRFAADLSGDLINLQIPQVNYNAAEGVKPLWADLKFYPNSEGKLLYEVIDYGDYPK